MLTSRSRRGVVSLDRKQRLSEAARCAVEPLEPRRLLSAGDLDSTFGRGGALIENPLLASDYPKVGIDEYRDGANAVAIPKSGGIIVVGGGPGDFNIARYLPDGTNDSSFGDNGFVATTFPGSTPDSYGDVIGQSNDVLVEPNDDIVVAGSVHIGGHNLFSVGRYSPTGVLDPSFGTGGLVAVDFGGDAEALSAAFDSTTGKIVVSGDVTDANGIASSAFIRLNSDGMLDNTFDGDGKLVIGLAAGMSNSAVGVALEPDGRVVAAIGDTFRLYEVSGVSEFTVVRLTTLGALDPSFGNGGIATAQPPGGNSHATALALEPNGSIVAVGTATSESELEFGDTQTDVALVRFTSAGQLDPTFGGGDGEISPAPPSPGIINTPWPTWSSVAVLSDGRIVTTGTSYSNFRDNQYIAGRYLPDGTPDPTFNTNFPYAAGEASELRDLAVEADGKLILVGAADESQNNSIGPGPEGSTDFTLFQLSTDGTVDHSFGRDGYVFGRFPGLSGSFNESFTQPDGKVLVASDAFYISRFDANGTLDRSFGDGGTIDIPYDRLTVAVLPNGYILVAGGSSQDNPSENFSVSRFTPNGVLDPSFGKSGTATIDFGGSDVVVAMALQADGSVVLVGNTYSATNSKLAMTRITPSGAVDTSFGRGGKVIQAFGDYPEVSGVAIDSSGRIIVSVNTATPTLARFSANGAPDNSFGGGQSNFVSAGPAGVQITGLAENAGDAALVAESLYPDLTVAGFSANAIYVAKVTSGGSLDPSFGNNGFSTIDLPGMGAIAGLTVDSDQKIVVAGTSSPANYAPNQVVVARLSASGQLDPSFGNGGMVMTSHNGLASVAGVSVDAHNRVLVAGEFTPAGWSFGGYAMLLRYVGSAGGASIKGTFYNDANQNGQQDAGEAPLVGWTAYVDTNLNGVIDPGEPSALTGTDGSYTIAGLDPGPYRVREVRQNAWARTQPAGVYPLGYYDLTLADGATSSGNDFGNFAPAGTPTPVSSPTPAPRGGLSGAISGALPRMIVTGSKLKGKLSVTITNTTTQAVSGPATVRLYLSSDSTVDSSDAVIAVASAKVNLAPGASKDVKLKISYSMRLAADQYRLLAQVTDTNKLTTVTIGQSINVVAPSVDPAISFPSPLGITFTPGGNATATVLVRNNGNVIAKGAATLTLSASPGTSADASDPAVITAKLKLNLKPGAAKIYRVKFLFPESVPPGSYHLSATLSAAGLGDSDITNNDAIAAGAFTLN